MWLKCLIFKQQVIEKSKAALATNIYDPLQPLNRLFEQDIILEAFVLGKNIGLQNLKSGKRIANQGEHSCEKCRTDKRKAKVVIFFMQITP
jgi:hypothetical protein